MTEAGPGSPGNETSRFGRATKMALTKYQQANNILPASGALDAQTRALINRQLK